VVSLWRKRFFADRLPGLEEHARPGRPRTFPPQISSFRLKALACELPSKYDLSLSRWSTSDLVQQVQQSGLFAYVSGRTLWRWLHEDAIRPWSMLSQRAESSSFGSKSRRRSAREFSPAARSSVAQAVAWSSIYRKAGVD
jgi:hypothetical protein